MKGQDLIREVPFADQFLGSWSICSLQMHQPLESSTGHRDDCNYDLILMPLFQSIDSLLGKRKLSVSINRFPIRLAKIVDIQLGLVYFLL